MEKQVGLNGLKMSLDIKFNRKLTEADYVIPGGYEMVFGGRSIPFDFQDHCGTIDKNDPTILHCELEHPDFDAFEEFRSVTTEELYCVKEITECYVYIGEECSPELIEVEVLVITFWLDNGDSIDIRDDVIQKYNITLRKERK